MTAPFQTHSDTSRTAAVAIQPRAGTLRAKVLAHLKTCLHGATDKEMQAALFMAGSTQRPRRIELVTAGLARDSGVRRDRCAVWVAR